MSVQWLARMLVLMESASGDLSGVRVCLGGGGWIRCGRSAGLSVTRANDQCGVEPDPPGIGSIRFDRVQLCLGEKAVLAHIAQVAGRRGTFGRPAGGGEGGL